MSKTAYITIEVTVLLDEVEQFFLYMQDFPWSWYQVDEENEKSA